MLEFNNQTIDTDKQGYLLDHTDWSKELADVIAQHESIILTEQHWEVVNFVRAFYLEYNTSPAIRMLVKAMAKALGDRPNKRLKLRAYLNLHGVFNETKS